ncbi:MAG: YybH family protein [Ramlibacter sp.]
MTNPFRNYLFAFALLCAAALPAHAAEPAEPTLSLPPGMAALARAADDAWNRRDPAAMVAFFADDGTSTIGKTELKGKAQMLDYYTGSFRNLPPGLTHRTVVRRVERIGGMVATDNAVYIEAPDGAQGRRVLREFFTFSLLRPVAGGWEFVAVRATPLAPAQGS